MSDIKTVIALLCKHLNLSIHVTFQPEYFRLAKYNEADKNITEILWRTLHILSYHTVCEKENNILFLEYDMLTAVKLYFAYLDYQVIEFYSLTLDENCNRQLLLAFAWLLGTHDVLNTIIKSRLLNSSLGKEFSSPHPHNKNSVQIDSSLSASALTNSILQLSGKINFNLKEISELVWEKAALMAKAHAASLNVSGLLHLSVSEVALSKQHAPIKKGTQSDNKQELLHDMYKTASLLDIHMKWMKKEHVFYDWMVTVLQEHNNCSERKEMNWCEILKFISLMHSAIKKRLNTLSSVEVLQTIPNKNTVCASRLLRIQNSHTEIEKWLTEVNDLVAEAEDNLREKKEEISVQLKSMLKLLPPCVQI